MLLKQKIINFFNIYIEKIKLWNLSQKMMEFKAIIFMISLLLLLGLFNYIVKHLFTAKPEFKQKIVVKIQAAIKKDVPVKIYATGKVNPINSVTVFSQTEGILLNALFKEGSQVERDQLLFEIDSTLLAAEYRKAQANLNMADADLYNAELKLQKSTQLYKNKFISLQEQEQVIANHKVAKANQQAAIAALDSNKTKLDFSKIYAPISGFAGEILIKPGTVIKANLSSPLVNINQLDPIHVFFTIPEEYLPELTKNFANLDKLVVQIIDYKKTGKLVFLNNQVDNLNGTILLKAEFCNSDLALWPGQLVNLDLSIKQLYDAILIPTVAVQTGQEGSYVYVAKLLKKNKGKCIAKINKTSIKTGSTIENDIVITAGLKAGDLVVTEGYSNLIDQAMVEVYVP